MKVALVCPASLPATQFGGIMFLCVDIARELAKKGHEVVIFTTDLDFANNAKTFNKKLPRLEKINNFTINRTHVYFAFQLFFVNPGIYFQMKKYKPDIIHTVGVRSFQSFMAALLVSGSFLIDAQLLSKISIPLTLLNLPTNKIKFSCMEYFSLKFI